nr:MAG TPA: holin [Microviridae sp.]
MLDPEQSNTLVNLIIGVVTFLVGLFINPKKKK